MQKTPPLTIDDIQSMLERMLKPLMRAQEETAADVKKLALDHVTRADLNDLRDDMQENFNRQDQRYYERGILDERFKSQHDRVTALEAANKEALGRNIQIFTAVIAVLGFLLATLNYLPHLSFHP